MKRRVGLLMATILLLALIPAVLAGGWAVVSLDEPPGDIHAGEPWRADFTVLQHGKTPVHDLDANSPVEPLLIAENPASGQRLEIMAERLKETGRFTVEVTFPSDGTWEWTILPNPLLGETVFEPLTVLPAANAAAVKEVKPAAEPAIAAPAITQPEEVVQPAAPATVDAGFSWQAGLRWAALALGLVAVALFLLQGRKRSSAQARVES
ncbi:hypothetical protein [Promineifilum sp.]|uniref:hypothetical protein n=1 Tax=Promineifilum sp. TaxID=2664178 RepID=UPI0035B2BFFD